MPEFETPSSIEYGELGPIVLLVPNSSAYLSARNEVSFVSVPWNFDYSNRYTSLSLSLRRFGVSVNRESRTFGVSTEASARVMQ